jgi:hypothetical protein
MHAMRPGDDVAPQFMLMCGSGFVALLRCGKSANQFHEQVPTSLLT